MHNIIRRLAVAGTAVVTLGTGAVVAASSSASAATSYLRCGTNQVSVSVKQAPGGPGAGQNYFDVDFRNHGSGYCNLYGSPGVSAVNAKGAQLGDAAARTGTPPARYIDLAPGQTAHAVLKWSDPLDFPASCKPVEATYLKVYPPNDKYAEEVPFRELACSAHQPLPYLQINRVQAGA
jgi:hypothetical protein